METKHNYLNAELPLIGERYFVYMSGGIEDNSNPAVETKVEKNDPAKDKPVVETQGKVDTKAGPEKGEIVKQQPEQKETQKQLVDRALDTIDWIDTMMEKLKDLKYKESKQFGDLAKNLAEIQNGLKTILENNTDKKDEVRENVLKMLNDTLKIYQEANKATGGKIDIPEPKQAPKPEPKFGLKTEPVLTPGKSDETPVKVPDKQAKAPVQANTPEKLHAEPKEKLSYLLGKVVEGGRESFDQNKNEITKLIESLNIQPGTDGKAVSVDLPGGFTLGYVNWAKTVGKNPNFAIFKDGETVCYMQDNGGAKMELTHARELGQNERPDFGRRVAELIKCNVMLPKALSQIKEHPDTKNIIFANPTAINDFKASLMTMAKMSQTDKPSWEANYGGKIVQFERKGPMSGVFKIEVNGKMLYFDTSKQNSIGLEQPAKKGGKEVSYKNDGDFLLKPEKQVQSDRRESILESRGKEQKKDEELAKKQEEEKQKQEQEAKVKEEQKAKVESLVKVEVNGKFGFVDKTGKEIVPPKYDDIHEFSEGLAKVQIDGKRGFINTEGKEVVELKYDKAWKFSEGLAKVKANGKFGFVDKTGKEIVPPKYDNAKDFKEGLATVQLGDKRGFVNTEGKEVVELKYDKAGDFSEGLAMVQLGNKLGFVDKTGKEIVVPQYDNAKDFKDGEAWVKKGDKVMFIDKTGKVKEQEAVFEDDPVSKSGEPVAPLE